MRRAVVVMIGVAALVAGCSTGGPGGGPGAMPVPPPTPTATETPLPGTTIPERPEGIDPRCTASYPDVTLEVIHERDLPLRPELWPFAPDFAALCWGQVWDTEQMAYYATDPGIVRAEVFRFYEEKFNGRGTHWRMTGDTGEILTGVFPPQHSYYIEHDYETNTYIITWAIDGDYND